MERTNSGALLLIVYLLLAAYLMPLYSTAGSATELTDWATAVSLVENSSFNIAELQNTVGVRFESVETDKNGGVYSTKAPGLTLLSAPIYAITRTIIGRAHSGNIQTSWFVLKLSFSSLPLLFLGLWLYNRDVDSYSLAALLFGTTVAPAEINSVTGGIDGIDNGTLTNGDIIGVWS